MISSEMYKKSIFINCPFDKNYKAIFHAIIFMALDCGYMPRCAFEADNGTENRLKKIIALIKNCCLGIHDISRTELDKSNRLPRFNMPFELGLFFGARYYGQKEHRFKNCLILDSKNFRFQKFISDIAGHDIKIHGNAYQKAISAVREWLLPQTEKNVFLPSSKSITVRYNVFHQQRLPEVCKQLQLPAPDKLSFIEYRKLATYWIKDNPPHPYLHHLANEKYEQ